MHPKSHTQTVADLGEFGLIARVVQGRSQPASTLLGPGDDAAVVSAADSRVVAATDVLVEGVHFRLDWSSAEQVGRKAIAQNAADIAAMGAMSTAFLVGLCCPATTPVTVIDALVQGMWAETDALGAGIVGGDVVRGDSLVISVAALGDLQGREPVTRGGALDGDVLAVAGRLGWAAAGLAVLSRGFRAPAAVVSAHRVPEPPYAAALAAADAGATSMTDISDGLLADLGHVAEASGVAIEVRRSTLAPHQRLVDVGSALGVDPWTWVLTGGEDHAFAATFSRATPLPEGWTVIGSVSSGSGVTVDGAEWAAADGPTGWQAFGK
ncbi:MAG: thiamine-phosphate kinase [Mycobacteriaceae bacterium]